MKAIKVLAAVIVLAFLSQPLTFAQSNVGGVIQQEKAIKKQKELEKETVAQVVEGVEAKIAGAVPAAAPVAEAPKA